MTQESFTFEAQGRSFTAVVEWEQPLQATVTVNVDGRDIRFEADEHAEMVAVNPSSTDPELLAVIGKAILER